MKTMWHIGLRMGHFRKKQAGSGSRFDKWGGILTSIGFAFLFAFGVLISLFLSHHEASAQSASLAPDSSQSSEKISPATGRLEPIPYEERLRFFVDAATKDFLIEMAAKERLLLQTIENLTAEIKQRGVEGLVNDDPGFDLLYKKMQTMSANYTAELEAILAVLDEISALSRTLARERRYDLVEQFQNLRVRLIAALEDRELYKKAPATTGRVTGMIREYDVEVDSLLRIYNRLEKFQKRAAAKSDTAMLPLLEKQKANIIKMVADYKSGAPAAPDVAEAFLKEAEQISALLAELDNLEKQAGHTLEASIEIEAQRRQIVSRLDHRLLRLVGYKEYSGLQKPTIEQVFNVWRGERLADYEARLTEYTIMKKRLLETGNTKERSRMLERDLTDALLNYASENYLPAELQLNAVLRDYDPYFSNWDAVIFYHSEALYARAIYPSSFESYEELLRTYPDSRFLGLALLRLLTISHTLKWEQPFLAYYHRIDSSDSSSGGPSRKTGAKAIHHRIVERARYLAGYYFLDSDRYAEAEAELSKIPQGSKYYFASRYLLGITQANQGNLSSAMQHFRYVAESEAGPVPGVKLPDPTRTLVRNNALMRLGFIHYQRGELESAIRYFEQVSRGAENYDQTLMGLAWAYLKQGDLDGSITAAGTLLGNYLASNYQYEALVLTAHCRRLLDQPQAALKDLRYVANAHGMLELSQEYDEERQQILAQLGELKRMEKTALDNRDKQLYDLISAAQQSLVGMMFSFGYRSNTGALLVEEFSDERQEIYRQIQRLDRLAAEANTMGLLDVARNAIEQRNRLVRVLETYQADRSIQNVNYFVDYPLITKETQSAYRRQIVLNLFQDMETEQARLRQNLATAQKLISETNVPSAKLALDLKTVQEDFKNLKYRMDRFQTWLSSYRVDEIETDLDQWADLAGFGMSDIAFQELNKREQKIDLYSQNIASIDQLLHHRKSALEQMLKSFEKEMRKIEESLINEQVRLDKLEHETYFQHSYFDTSDSEVEKTKQPSVKNLLDEQLP